MSKSCDLLGKRFGKLTVIEKKAETECRYHTWLCRCDCGGEITVSTKHLNRGTVSDCGCTRPRKGGSRPLDISGQRYGRLTAVERTENSPGGRTAWRCVCDCGRETVVTTHDLRGGERKDCGCGIGRPPRPKAELSGKTIGRLKVLYASEDRDYKGSVIWHCRCACGTELDLSESNLMHGNYRSCGCLKKETMAVIHTRLTRVENTCIEWLKFRKSRSDNTSGFRGVYKSSGGKWRACIGLLGKRYEIGRYSSFDDAVKARLVVEEALHDGFIEAYEQWTAKAEENESWSESNPFFFRVLKENGAFCVTSPSGIRTVDIP